jgi:glycoside/pentoside/hexuronide:cation symporter, GPH family
VASARKLSIVTMLSFGVGNSAEGIKSAAFGAFLLFYYQQVLGVPGVLTGAALALSLLADAITDPMVGHLSDSARSRYGRRHPFIALAAVPLGLCFFLLFSPPQGLSDFGYFIWLAVFAISARVAMTFYDIPHLALGAEMAPDYQQRTTLFSISTWFRVVSGAAVTFVAYRFLFPTTTAYDPGLLNPAGYFWLGLIFGCVMITVLTICVLGTKSEIPFLRKSDDADRMNLLGVVRQMLGTWQSPSFRYVFLGLFLYVLIVNVEQSLGTYMAVHFWGLTTETMSLLPLASLAGAVVAFPTVNLLTHLIDKRRVLILVTCIGFLNINLFVAGRLFLPDFLPENGSPLITGFVVTNFFVTGFISLSVITTINSMYADIADEYELIAGKRREGMLYATRSFANKAAAAIGLFLGGLLLDAIHFPAKASAGEVAGHTVWRLGFVYGPVTSIVMLVTIYLYHRYTLDRAALTDIQARLSARQRE